MKIKLHRLLCILVLTAVGAHAAPTTTSFTTMESTPTKADSVTYTMTFSEEVVGLNDGSDLILATVANSDVTIDLGLSTIATTDNQTFTITINGIEGDGNMRFRLKSGAVANLAGDLLVDRPRSPSIIFDHIVPTVLSISPNESGPITASTLSFTVDFSESMNGFDTFADLDVITTGTATATNATFAGSGSNYVVTLTGISGAGSLALAISTSSDVTDLVGNALISSPTSAAVVAVDTTAPTVLSIIPDESGPITTSILSFTVEFSESVTNFDDFADLDVITTGTATATGAAFAGSGSNYVVTLTGISGAGSLALAISTSSDVTDLVGNALISSPTSAVVAVDTTAPTVLSIIPNESGPITTSTLSFTLEFSESVTNFDDFADLDVITTGTATATAALFTGSGSNYVVTLSGVAGNGELALAVKTDTGVVDLAGNALASSVTSAGVQIGESLTFGDFEYRFINTNTEVEITGYNGTTNHVVCPDTIESKSVTSVGFEAFFNKTAIETIILPINLLTIGERAFNNCTNLVTIESSSVTNIGNEAFTDCVNLASISFSVATILGEGAFSYSGLTELTDSSLPLATTIGDDAFAECRSLTSVSLPAALTIGSGAFTECDSLTTVSLPVATQIGRGGLAACPSLTTVSLPVVTTLESVALADNRSLTHLSLPASLTNIGSFAFQNTGQLVPLFLGDAPTTGVGIFNNTSFTTVYYLEGATGFGATWEGKITVALDANTTPWLLDNGYAFDTDLLTDSNGDGVDLLTAYALDLDPTTNLSGSLPAGEINSASNTFSISYYAAAPGITYTVETTGALEDNSWTTNGVSHSALDTNSMQTASVPLSPTNGFLRLEVEN